MKIIKYTKKFKDYRERLYTHHLDSTINILLYLHDYMPIQISTPL